MNTQMHSLLVYSGCALHGTTNVYELVRYIRPSTSVSRANWSWLTEETRCGLAAPNNTTQHNTTR